MGYTKKDFQDLIDNAKIKTSDEILEEEDQNVIEKNN
jgi:hypothetical protein